MARMAAMASAGLVLLAGWLMATPLADRLSAQDPTWWLVRFGHLAGGSFALAGLVVRSSQAVWGGAVASALSAFLAAEQAWFLIPADIGLVLLVAWWQARQPQPFSPAPGWRRVA